MYVNASLRTTRSWFWRRGEIRLARERAIKSDRMGGRSHTFHSRILKKSEVGGEGFPFACAFDAGTAGISSTWSEEDEWLCRYSCLFEIRNLQILPSQEGSLFIPML